MSRGSTAALAALLGRRPTTLVRLAGGEPAVVYGETLAPELQLMLALRERVPGPKLWEVDPPAARRLTDRQARLAQGRPTAVGATVDLAVDGAAGPLPARHYVPPAGGRPGRAPLLVYFHGGGWTVGSIASHDEVCRLLCAHAGVHVLSVDYRLAPEHPFPAPVEDARASLRWAQANAAALGADPGRVAVGGDSAGGNLAAVACLLARDAGDDLPAAQLLVYPSVDFAETRPSVRAFGSGFFLEREERDFFAAAYRDGTGVADDDPRLSPLRAEDLSGLPPALVVTAAMDPLRDEGEAYAAALTAAGTPTALRRVSGLVHGFLNFSAVSPASRAATIALAGGLRGLLTEPPRR